MCRRRLRRLRRNKTIETLGTTQQVVTFQGDKDAVQCYANTPMQQEKAYNHEIDANGRMDINAIAIGPTREINPNMDSTDQISGIPTRGTTQQRQTPCCKT